MILWWLRLFFVLMLFTKISCVDIAEALAHGTSWLWSNQWLLNALEPSDADASN
jgi:hypothetical protein